MERELNSVTRDEDGTAVVLAGDYLNKITGERVERECRRCLDEGCKQLVVDFSQTEIVNSIGVSILLGVIDSASSAGARIVFSDVNEGTIELFEMLGVTNHVILQ
jgi:Anti-anti-sigma regulatory factor (antagonist of anti-sigma factor)